MDRNEAILLTLLEEQVRRYKHNRKRKVEKKKRNEKIGCALVIAIPLVILSIGVFCGLNQTAITIVAGIAFCCVFAFVTRKYREGQEEPTPEEVEQNVISALRTLLIGELRGDPYDTPEEWHDKAVKDGDIEQVWEYEIIERRRKYVYKQYFSGSDKWYATARPTRRGETGTRSYYIDRQTGRIRYRDCWKDKDPTADENSDLLTDG